MRRTRAARLLALAVVPIAVAIAACAPPKGMAIDWSIGPVQFELKSDGSIEVTGQRQWVTALGTFSVGQDPDASGADKLALVLRHQKDGTPVDDLFTIPTTADVLVETEGRTQIGIHGNTIRIDATQFRKVVLKGVVWQMPDLRGHDLRSAQDELGARTDGELTRSSTYDVSGRGRHITSDATVCTQSVPPGAPITADSNVGFGVVERGETCPDGSPTVSPLWTMPAFVGKPLDEANSDLDRLTGGTITAANTHDATGADRKRILTGGWKICSQIPAPTSMIAAGTPIEFGIVGEDELCPATAY